MNILHIWFVGVMNFWIMGRIQSCRFLRIFTYTDNVFLKLGSMILEGSWNRRKLTVKIWRNPTLRIVPLIQIDNKLLILLSIWKIWLQSNLNSFSHEFITYKYLKNSSIGEYSIFDHHPNKIGNCAQNIYNDPGENVGALFLKYIFNTISKTVTTGLNPHGIEPNGIEPTELNPHRIEPNGIEPNGIEPTRDWTHTGLNPHGIEPARD